MSEEQKSVTKSDPSDVIFAKVYVPEFLKSAAARGHVPSSEDEVVEMLKIAAKLRKVSAEQVAEQPASVIKQASDNLSGMLGQAEVAPSYLQDTEVADAVAGLLV